ncbi:MAG: adenylosuccinate lyase, partial [Promethearchaeota archaeon]
KGIGRQEGHEILRKAVIRSKKENRFIKDILLENAKIRENFDEVELDNLFDPHKYIGRALEQTMNLIKYLKNKYKI